MTKNNTLLLFSIRVLQEHINHKTKYYENYKPNWILIIIYNYIYNLKYHSSQLDHHHHHLFHCHKFLEKKKNQKKE
jgi:hypothetical protein